MSQSCRPEIYSLALTEVYASALILKQRFGPMSDMSLSTVAQFYSLSWRRPAGLSAAVTRHNATRFQLFVCLNKFWSNNVVMAGLDKY